MRIKKILLIQPMHEKEGKRKKKTSISFPWGLAYLAAMYRRSGYEVEILDGQALQKPKEDLIQEMARKDFDVVGITAFSTQHPAVKLIAEHVKSERKTPVIVGGPLATYQPEMVLRTTESDVCVIGEGEISGVQVLDHFDDLEKVRGIAFKRNGIHVTPPREKSFDLEDLPYPDFSLFDIEKYLSAKISFSKGRKNTAEGRGITFTTSRGCPYNCYFCSKSSDGFSSMSPKKICDILSRLKSDFRVEKVSFGDELFLSNKKRFRELSPMIKRLDLRWGGQARVNLVDEEFLDMIKDAGCEGIGYGIESGSQKILNNMNKQTTVHQIEKAMTYTQKIGIPIKVQLIFGYPGEDESTLQETIDLFKRVDNPGRRFTVITPLPGSKIYNDCIAQGFIKDEPAYLAAIEKSFGIGRVHVNFTNWPDEEIYPRKKEVERIMIENYYNKSLARKATRLAKKSRGVLGNIKRRFMK